MPLKWIACLVLVAATAGAATIPVRHAAGLLHGFLVLKTMDGAAIAGGELIQRAEGTRVTLELSFHFTDGSVYEETAVYSQRGRIRLITDHLVQRGPSFPQPLEATIDCAAGRVTVRDEKASPAERKTHDLALPADVANGLLLTLLQNVPPHAPASFSFVALTPKPELVTLVVTRAGQEPFVAAGLQRQATHFVITPKIGGVKGLLAPLVGKQPPDAHVWMLEGEAPAFVRAEQQLYAGGPVWRIELAAPALR